MSGKAGQAQRCLRPTLTCKESKLGGNFINSHILRKGLGAPRLFDMPSSPGQTFLRFNWTYSSSPPWHLLSFLQSQPQPQLCKLPLSSEERSPVTPHHTQEHTQDQSPRFSALLRCGPDSTCLSLSLPPSTPSKGESQWVAMDTRLRSPSSAIIQSCPPCWRQVSNCLA